MQSRDACGLCGSGARALALFRRTGLIAGERLPDHANTTFGSLRHEAAHPAFIAASPNDCVDSPEGGLRTRQGNPFHLGDARVKSYFVIDFGGLGLSEDERGSLLSPDFPLFKSLLGAEGLPGLVIMISVSEFGFFFVAPVEVDWASSKPDPLVRKAAAIDMSKTSFICRSCLLSVDPEATTVDLIWINDYPSTCWINALGARSYLLGARRRICP